MNIKKFSEGLIGGSLILLVTINLFFVINYFFHFAMARMLPIEQYGVLVALYSIIYILGIFTESIQLVISKYTTREKDLGKVKNIFKKSSSKGIKISFYIFISYLFAGIIIAKVLKIDYALVSLTGLIIFSSFLLPISRGILQGKKRFFSLGGNMILESTVKLISAVLLVLVGLMIYGAVIATLLGTYIALLFSIGSLKNILNKEEKDGETPGIYGYSFPVIFIIAIIVIFYSIDVIIAKIVFSPEIAGIYAIASTISKVIFFGTQPIGKALFPITSDENNLKPKKAIKQSLAIIGFLIIVALGVIYFFTDLLVLIFSGRVIPEIRGILIYTGLATSFISLANLLLLYNLSLGKTKKYLFLSLFLIIEIALMFYFSQSLVSFSKAFFSSAVLFFVGAVLFSYKNRII
jgi:O-antigen/teichoic acid export membrane protein